jgi:methionine sulfoxide reductase heme-binding subunit
MRVGRGAALRSIVTHTVLALALLPAAILAHDIIAGPLRANPYPPLIRESGLWSMRLLVVGLAVRPATALSGLGGLMRQRRTIGLLAAAYALLHLAAWATDYGFAWAFLGSELLTRPYLAVGAVAALLLVPLTATSTKAAVRRLGGRAWQRLHRLVYPAAIAAYVHFLLATAVVPGPEHLVDGALLGGLLVWRYVKRGSLRGGTERPA